MRRSCPKYVPTVSHEAVNIDAAVQPRPVSGHVFRVEGRRRPVWRAKYRLPDGRQVQRTIGRRGPRGPAAVVAEADGGGDRADRHRGAAVALHGGCCTKASEKLWNLKGGRRNAIRSPWRQSRPIWLGESGHSEHGPPRICDSLGGSSSAAASTPHADASGETARESRHPDASRQAAGLRACGGKRSSRLGDEARCSPRQAPVNLVTLVGAAPSWSPSSPIAPCLRPTVTVLRVCSPWFLPHAAGRSSTCTRLCCAHWEFLTLRTSATRTRHAAASPIRPRQRSERSLSSTNSTARRARSATNSGSSARPRLWASVRPPNPSGIETPTSPLP